jgi:hypothetical protein
MQSMQSFLISNGASGAHLYAIAAPASIALLCIKQHNYDFSWFAFALTKEVHLCHPMHVHTNKC